MSKPRPVNLAEADWPVRTVGEMTALLRRGTAPVYVDESDVMAIGQRCITDTDFDGSRARPHSPATIGRVLTPESGDVLINSTGTGTIGRSVIFHDEAGEYIVDGHVTVARPRQTDLASRWLNDILRSPAGQRYLESRCYAGSTNQIELSSSALATLPIAVPSIAEQQRVAEVLDTLDGQIRSIRQLIEKLRLTKQGALADFMTRGVADDGSVRAPYDKAPELYVDHGIGPRPKTWIDGLLDDFAMRGSGHTPNKNVPSFWNGGIKWVSLADSSKLDQLYIHNTDKTISVDGIANSSAVLHPAGTVILSRDAGVGKSAILAEDMAVSQHFMAWKTGPRLVNTYLYYWLQYMKREFEAIAMGSTIKTIGLPYFRKLRILVPSLNEQERIAEFLLQADRTIDAATAELIGLRRLKDGLMFDLLTGRARVPSEVSR